MSRKIVIASLIWGASILLSRCIGLLREAVIGRVLGGGGEADVYFVAFTVPDYLYYLLAGGALSIVFIPIFHRHLADGHEERGWESFSNIANFLLLLLLVVLPVLWWIMPYLAPWIAPGFDARQTERLIYLTRIILPAQAFHLIGGLLSAVLQARDRHTLPALAPLLYTSGIIAGGLLGGSAAGADGFAWGVLAGSFLGPFGLPLWGAMRMGLRWHLVLDRHHPDLKAYFLRSLPIMLAFSIVVVDDWILRRLGSFLGEGAVATANYAKQLMRVPMGAFGLAAGVAAFPTLTRLIAEGNPSEAYTLLGRALRLMLIPAFAAQVVLTVAGSEISQLVYGRRISLEQHHAIGFALALFCLGLWAWAAQSMLARGFYAIGNTWTPSVVGTLLAPLAYPLYVLWGDRWGINGLALASTVAVTFYVLLLWWILYRRFGFIPLNNISFFCRILPCVALGIGFGLLGRFFLDISSSFLRFIILSCLGCGVFFLTALGLRVGEVNECCQALFRRWKRRKN